MHCWMYCDWKHDVLVLWLEAWRVGTVAGVMICWYCDWSHDVLVLWLELWRVGTVTGVMTCWYCDWSHDVLVLWLESWRVGTVTGGRSHDVLVLWLESWCVGTVTGVMMCWYCGWSHDVFVPLSVHVYIPVQHWHDILQSIWQISTILTLWEQLAFSGQNVKKGQGYGRMTCACFTAVTEVILDGISSEQVKLNHPTTDRPRVPARRPPALYQNSPTTQNAPTTDTVCHLVICPIPIA